MNQTAIFDLWQVQNELIGDVWLLIILGLMVTWFMAIKGKVGYKVATMLSLIWLSIMFAKTNIIIIWILVILAAGLMFYFQQARVIRRG